MSNCRLASVVHKAQVLAGVSDAAEGATDAELLDRLVRLRDQAAFDAIVRRYGPLVWRVCRRMLPQNDRAEDCYQAVFLVLARQARAIRKRTALASWLHGVAARVARRARNDSQRVEVHGAVAPQGTANDPAHEATWRELGRILEEEVSRLPEKLSEPILMCYWRGLSNDEAARQLGLPSGTLKARLAKARAVLHARLVRRGVTLPAGGVLLLLAPGSAEAELPACLVSGTAEMAGLTAEAVGLADAVLRVTGIVQLRFALAVLVALGVAGLGAGLLWPSAAAGPEAANEPPAQAKAAKQPAAGEDADPRGDPLPAGAIARLGTAGYRLGTPIQALAVSRDGRLAVAANDSHIFGSTRAFDLDTGRVLYAFPETVRFVEAVALSPKESIHAVG